MLKRLFDVVASAAGLIVASPVLLPVIFLVWRQDRHSPFYIAPRVGKNDKPFKMVKLRSMVINADKTGVDSTSANDNRITAVGQFIRRYKLDELTQLWNVFKGDMSLVGPRPNVKRETDLYTPVERKLLEVKPGITDISSIVFSDEGDILKDQADPDIAYNQLIRPGKSMLGILYIENQSLWLDIKLCFLTVIAVLSREKALAGVQAVLKDINAPEALRQLALRQQPLVPQPPPGGDRIVTSRDGNPFA
ncbi:MAG: sugar transferase [Burkholderiaceae bacterium]|uniref:sugar transferase n=1 Tax=Polaromonas sp. YR568 TaxID=1855301 RepID=UPI002720668B|nr:sugar transferase [Burkholderiaceae bacterium]MDO9316933.1 sugar transferase [Gammaproteobacteria bacterium]